MADSRRQIEPRRHAWLFSALTLALGLLLTEGTLRVFSVASGPTGKELRDYDPLGAKYEPHGEFGYRQKPNAAYPYGNGTVAHSNSMSYRGPEVRLKKPRGTYRIVLLGGSTTHGFGVDDGETIDAHMRRILAESRPGVPFEVVNLALGGYDAYQAFERLRTDGVPMSPDLVIVNTGINDVRNAQFESLEIPGPDPRTLIWEDHLSRLRAERATGGPSAWTLAKHYLYLARFPGFVRQRIRGSQRIDQMNEVRPKPDAVEYFAFQVRRILDLSDSIGAAVLLSTPASALRYMDPKSMSHRGYWIIDAKTTEAYRRRLGERLERLAASAQAQGRPVRYLSHDIAHEMFIDDCHLNSDGNRSVAKAFVSAAAPFIESRRPDISGPRG